MAAQGVFAIVPHQSIWRRPLYSSVCKASSLMQPRPFLLRRNPCLRTAGCIWDLRSKGGLKRYTGASSRSQGTYWCYAQASNGTSVKIPEADNQVSQTEDHLKDTWTVKMLFDGCCPLCMREVNMLRERNLSYKAIKFVDISAPDYSPKENAGIDFATAMGRIHAILPDGTILYNIKAFKKFYEAVGLGWVYAFTQFEPVAKIADAMYSIWAKYRLPLTGRPPLVQILEERQRKANEQCNRDNCRMH